MHIEVLICLCSEPFLVNTIHPCILLIVSIIRAEMSVCLWACVCMCMHEDRICMRLIVCLLLYLSVCYSMYVSVRQVRAHTGDVIQLVYLQNFPGGQGKHSLSSCSPPWFEWVYVPLGQGWGTMVPEKKCNKCKKTKTDSMIYYIVITTREYVEAVFWSLYIVCDV